MESIMFRIMNLKELFALEEEIDLLTDEEERKERHDLLDKIQGAVTDYDVYVREYAYKQNLQALIDRGIVFQPVKRECVVTLWDKQFDSLVSADAKKASPYYSDQFRWHLFSFELLPAIKEDEARKAFDEMAKDELYLFFDYCDEAYRVKNAHLLTAGDVEALRENSSLDKSDMYFFAPVGKWTYVKPHEDYLGPYFFSAE